MSLTNIYLRGDQPRARWKRLDTAQMLKRSFFSERSLIAKEQQIAMLATSTAQELVADHRNRSRAEAWITEFSHATARLGGIGTDEAPPDVEISPIPGSQPALVPDLPARDRRYWTCRFYWPDIIDSDFPYGEGLLLQLRSAVSHLNEVLAGEHGGILLCEFSDVLPWEWIHDAARWTYHEPRHSPMGPNR